MHTTILQLWLVCHFTLVALELSHSKTSCLEPHLTSRLKYYRRFRGAEKSITFLMCSIMSIKVHQKSQCCPLSLVFMLCVSL